MKNKNEPKTSLLAFSKANSIQYHFIEVMRCIFLVFKLKNSSQKPLKDKLQILHLNFKFKVSEALHKEYLLICHWQENRFSIK